MGVKELYQKILGSEEYKEWRKGHSKDYLVHAFFTDQGQEYGFYNKERDEITTFRVLKKVELVSTDKIFKKDDKAILELSIDKVKVTLEQALEKTKELLENEKVNKAISVLQHLESGQLWNVTIITDRFNVLNAKIDAATGEVLSHQKQAAMEFREVEK